MSKKACATFAELFQSCWQGINKCRPMQDCDSVLHGPTVYALGRVDLDVRPERTIEVHTAQELVVIPNTHVATKLIQLLLQFDADCFAD